MDIADQIRSECATVAAAATHVQINFKRVSSYAAELAGLNAQPTRPQLLDGASRERAAAYWMTLDAINFGSGWFPTLLKLPGMTGYRTIKAGVDRRFRDNGPWSAAQLQKITAAELSTLTGQLPDHPLMPLFKASLRDLGSHVEREMNGHFATLIDKANRSAMSFVQELSTWACFADRSEYNGCQIPFLKRAQLAAADLQRANAASWDDAHRLTLFADNLVPHVLRLDGLLTFEPELARRIQAEELIEHGSPEEVEIRASALHMVELLSHASSMTPAALDELLWNRGQEASYKAVPRHRSRCTAY